MAKPNVSNNQIISNLTTSWADDSGMTHTWLTQDIQFSLPTTSPDGSSDEEDGFQALTPNEATLARAAFQLWDDLIANTITEKTGSNAPITFAYSSTTDSDGTYTYSHTDDHTSTDKKLTGAEIWIDSNWDSNKNANVKIGSYGFMTYIHEIGHSLGLSHPGVYNATDDQAPTYDNDATYSRDTRQYTVMSYFGEGSDGSGANYNGSNASTPMIDDIMAIQAKYGADMTTRTGNTTYGFNSNAGEAVYDFGVNTKPVFSIWDAGGNDTIDADQFSCNQIIDLKAGHYSSIGGLSENIGIAYNVTVENAIGGSGWDTISGNDVANSLSGHQGNDVLLGQGGRDTLDGGAGDDTLDGGSGVDTMAGGSGDDTYYVDNKGQLVMQSAAHAAANLVGVEPVWFGDNVIELANQGTDKVFSSIDYTLGSNVENLELIGSANLNGAGNNLDNTIIGNAGANMLSGGGGNDTLNGMAGVDTMKGGTGDDTYYVDDKGELVVGGAHAAAIGIGVGTLWFGDKVVEAAGSGYDTVMASVSYTLADNVEELDLTGTQALNGGGNNLDNVIYGNDSNNSLGGFGGNDQIYGMGGNDILAGGAGNDTLDGGTGADKMAGGAGDDTYHVDMVGRWRFVFGGDLVFVPGDQITENAGEGNDTVFSSVSYTLGANVENLTLTGSNTSSATGNELDNAIAGNDSANFLDGKGGHDTLTGFGGADTFMFSSTLDGNNIARITDFSVANDMIRLAAGIFSTLASGLLAADEFIVGDHAIDNNDHLIYNADTGALSYDANGSDAGGETQFATLGKHLDLTNQEFFVV